MANTTHVNYDGLFESSASVRCASCKHEFKFQSFVSGFCPACGKKIIGMKADNVPMQYVPKGYKAYLFNRYEQYREYYYNNKEHWSEVVRYEAVVYTVKKMIEEDGCIEGKELTPKTLLEKFARVKNDIAKAGLMLEYIINLVARFYILNTYF